MCHTCLHSFDRRKGRVISSLYSEKKERNGTATTIVMMEANECLAYIYRESENNIHKHMHS